MTSLFIRKYGNIRRIHRLQLIRIHSLHNNNNNNNIHSFKCRKRNQIYCHRAFNTLLQKFKVDNINSLEHIASTSTSTATATNSIDRDNRAATNNNNSNDINSSKNNNNYYNSDINNKNYINDNNNDNVNNMNNNDNNSNNNSNSNNMGEKGINLIHKTKSSLGIIVIFIVFIGILKKLYDYYGDSIRFELSRETADIASKTLNQKQIQDTTRIFVSGLIQDETLRKQFSALIIDILSSDEVRNATHSLAKDIVMSILDDPEVMSQLLNVLKQDYTTKVVGDTLSRSIQTEAVKQSASKLGANTAHDVLSNELVKQHATLVIKEILSDEEIQNQAWNSIKATVTPKWWSSSSTPPQRGG